MRSWWTWIRPLAGVGILAFLLWRLGTSAFVDGLRLIDGWALTVALGIGVLTTVSCAWRWNLIATGLGVRLPLVTAVAHCYRSVFLNATLPGGVLGDVHRAVQHGRDVGDVRRGIRTVFWERSAGMVIQIALALVVLAMFPSPIQGYLPSMIALAAVAALVAVLVARALPRHGSSRLARVLRTAAGDLRHGVFARGTWLGIVVSTAVVLGGHLVTFLVAARTAGATAPLSHLIPLTLLALMAMAVPMNIGGFGPREGVAAWAFGAAGLTAAQGVGTAVVYGALVLVASLPGAAVLLVHRARTSANTVDSDGALIRVPQESAVSS